MEHRTVKHLRAALRDMERDIAIRANKLEQLRQGAQSLRQMLAIYGAEAEDEAGGVAPSAERETNTRMPHNDAKSARNAMYEMLRDAGEPMHARELLAGLAARGIKVVGKDPLNNVRSHLSHDVRFTPIGGGRWSLASRANGTGHGWGSSPGPRQSPTIDTAPSEPAAEHEPNSPHPPEADWDADPFLAAEREDELAYSGL